MRILTAPFAAALLLPIACWLRPAVAEVDLAGVSEGGTLLIPGHGRICDEGDLVRYRDMVTIIRDRIARLKELGNTLRQIKAAKPTLDYDSRFGVKEWAGDDFVAAVYASLGT